MGGHHHEYAVRVLRAAERRGYTPVLATNRACRGIDQARWRTVPAYRLGFWDLPLERGPRTDWIERLGRKARWVSRRLTYSRLGLLWAYRKRGMHLAQAASGLPRGWLVAMTPLVVVLAAVKTVGVVWSALGPLQPVLRWAWRAFVSLAKLALLPIWPVVALFKARRKLLTGVRQHLKSRYFGRDTCRLFRLIGLDRGDVVFIPTIAESEMVGLGPYFAGNPETAQATWHLLFRRNLYRGRETDYAEQESSLRPMRNSFNEFLSGCRGHRIHFWTDTEALTAQWNRLGAARFRTLPIPIDREYAEPRHAPPHRPLRVVYAGDARQEKGYGELPRIIGDLWPEHIETGRARFVLQSNFAGSGDAASRIARDQLQRLDTGTANSPIRLLLDALDGDAYRELVVSGDVVLVLYDRDNYYARSSGIFAEAMVAGIPVVVPSGSWMAVNLADPTAQAHDAMLDRLERSRDLAEVEPGSLGWAVQYALSHNPYDPETGTLNVASSRPRFCWIDVPEGATHLCFQYRQAEGSAGQFGQLWITQLDAQSRPVREGGHVLGGVAGGRASVLVPIESSARRLWFGLTGAYSQAPMLLGEIRLAFALGQAPLPLGAVGVVYNRPSEISGALREVLDHAAHYRETAGRFAERWGAWHSPETLVTMLAGADRPSKLEPKLPNTSVPGAATPSVEGALSIEPGPGSLAGASRS